MRICCFLLFVSPVYLASSQTIRAKYVFYFIGDGMGMVQAQLADEYIKSQYGRDSGLSFITFPYRSFVTTYAQNRYITCSAAGGTALANGQKSSINTIGKNADRTCEYRSVIASAHTFGMKTGIISSVFINHATPACFYAHSNDRNNMYEIAMQIPGSGVDFFAGGNISENKGKDGKQPDAYEAAEKAGYIVPRSMAEFTAAPKGSKILFATGKTLGTEILTPRINRTTPYISLADITEKAIDHLYSPTGFMIMIEGGAIDWACHDNDAASELQETIDMDMAVREAMKFYSQHPNETLIVVTADHETGGMTLGCSNSGYESDYALLRYQKASYGTISDTLKKAIGSGADFEKCLAIIGTYTGLGTAISLSENDRTELRTSYGHSQYYSQNNKKQYTDTYGEKNPMVVCALKMLACKAGIGWTTFAHTGAAVPVYAIGAGAEHLADIKDNTEIARTMLQIISGTYGPGQTVCPEK